MASAKLPEVPLRHILEHVDGILNATADMAPEQILGDYLTVRAVERALQIISEAAKELPEEMRSREPDVPWRAIIGIGNLLRHEYYRIRDADLLDILRVHLPLLKPAIERLLLTVDDG
ncbi:MAG: DUF86 domain-containing protein [Amphiplicatus sp.]|nr:DUF86 domain-containing protein [Amphiplicatus sp.]HPG05038.1 DUF86 domain-containing protein [Rhodoblastus sp.]